MRWSLTMLLAAAAVLLAAVPASAQDAGKVLVFTERTGGAHPSTTDGVAAIQALGAENDFGVDVANDSSAFTSAGLRPYRAIVFLHVAGDVLSASEQTAFQNYIVGGGGFAGIGDTSRVETGSAWFTELVGARPTANSPADVKNNAVIEVGDRVHPATKNLPIEWTRSDVLTDWSSNPTGRVHTLAIARERSYKTNPNVNAWNHPIAWCRDYQGGRSFYTALGYTSASYAEPNFRQHLLGGIRWAAGMVRGNCKATINANYVEERLTQPNKEEGTFNPATEPWTAQAKWTDQIGEPHGITIAPDGRVFYIGRGDRSQHTNPVDSWRRDQNGFRGVGQIHVWDPSKPAASRVSLVGALDVFGDSPCCSELQKKEEGLLGIVVDPDFLNNGWVYMHWTPYENVNMDANATVKGSRWAKRRISRFTIDLTTNKLVEGSEKKILEWEYQAHSCCHMGGDMGFDKDGNLYILAGDTNSSGGTSGYSANMAPTSFDADGAGPFKAIGFQDARRTAGNTNDFNGKILRIKPKANPTGEPGPGTTYDIPAGNLFGPGGVYPTVDPAKVVEEIYVMGVRNPTRLWIDQETGWVMTGWVGPDAADPSATLGPARYENMAVIDKAGNWGWPYCTGNNQPYRDRNATGATTGWYNCAAPKNESPHNDGLVDLPPIEPANMWYAGRGGGPVYPNRGGGGADANVPTYTTATETLSQPYLKGGGSQAVMTGPMYRYDPENTNPDAWPAYWDGKWIIGDNSSARARRAVTLDEDTVVNRKPPKSVTDIEGIVTTGKSGGSPMGWRFGPDGALYTLDYGGGFFTMADRSSLWRVKYVGGPSTPAPAGSAVPVGNLRARFNPGQSGGVSYAWDFGDGQTSTEAAPTHQYATAGLKTATLTVTYADGETSEQEIDVEVSETSDATAPVTTAELNPAEPGPGGTYTGRVDVTLNATDEGGTGVQKTEYRIGGGEFLTYGGTFRVSAPGTHVIQFRSEDNVGNLEETKEVTFTIAGSGACTNNLSDEFEGTDLDPKWDVLRPNPAAMSVSGGKLNQLVRAGDMQTTINTAQNVLLQDAPAGGTWTATTKVDISELSNAGEQAGLIVWESEVVEGDPSSKNNMVKIVYINKTGVDGRRFEYFATRNSANAGLKFTPDVPEIEDEVYLRASRDQDGTIHAEYSLNDQDWVTIGDPITGFGEDVRVGLKVSDNADSGNAAKFDWFRFDHVCPDEDAPVTVAETTPGAPDGALGWYTGPVDVELTADDGEGGTGVAKTEYSLDGGAWTEYADVVNVAGAGEHTFAYRSADERGNVEAIRSLRIKIDGDAPATTATLSPAAPAANGKYPGDVTVSLAGTDGGSGVERTEYRVDGGAWTTSAGASESLFDGTEASLEKWQQVGSGSFALKDGVLESEGGLGMLWYTGEQFSDFSLKFQAQDVREDGGHSNSGAFVRFPDPRIPLAMRPPGSCGTAGSAATSQAWVAIYCGHEIQLYDGIVGEPQKTGSIYNFAPTDLDQAGAESGWNDYEIRVVGQRYTVLRNGKVINEFDNAVPADSSRPGDPPTGKRQFPAGFIGLQNHGDDDKMQFRTVTVTDLSGNRNESVTVSGDGAHTVEYRSVDGAGNAEAAKSVSFTIGKDPTPVTPQGDAPQPTLPDGSGEVEDIGVLDSLGKVGKPSLRAFLKSGVRVTVRCEDGGAATAKLTVSKSTARKLRLGSRTIGTAKVTCKMNADLSVRIKPSKKARKALKQRKLSSVKLTLTVQSGDEVLRRGVTVKR